jgi:hypothetical protein
MLKRCQTDSEPHRNAGKTLWHDDDERFGESFTYSGVSTTHSWGLGCMRLARQALGANQAGASSSLTQVEIRILSSLDADLVIPHSGSIHAIHVGHCGGRDQRAERLAPASSRSTRGMEYALSTRRK